MAQTQPQQYSSQPFSPPVSTPSPGATSSANVGAGPPPPKRQRLSPLPQSQSPYASPSFGTMQLPQNPAPAMNGTNINGMASTPGPAPTPIPAPAPAPPGSMGPPSRPVEKPTDASELTDVLVSSGIDVKEEEAYLTNSYAPTAMQAQQPQRPPLPVLNTSFTSQVSTPGTTSTGTSFDLSQARPPSTQESIYVADPSSQPFKDPNEPTRENTQAARRAQYHLQEPFLLTKVLEQKLQKRGFELGVRIPTEGLFHPVPGRPQPIEVTGPDGSSTVRKGQTILNQEGAPLVDILTLMSLCCEERLRMVLEYASTLSKSRRLHSHGAVPAEWKDVAAPEPDSAVSPKTVSLKRPHAATEGSTTNRIAEKYRLLASKDLSSEEARAAKRAKRSANAILGESTGSRATSVDVPGSGSATPTSVIGDKGLGPDKKGLTKKEAKKQMDARASEAQQHQQSIETARMATNNMLSGRMFGNTKKTYSWLNRGTSTSSSFSSSRINAPSSIGGDKGGKPGDASAAAAATKRLGDWREDKEKGAGIQVRDILFMLEQDGRGMRHIQKAYSKDLKEDRVN
ncbi:hypothetical protein VTN77DRAFT_3215 [Rasamsonia byssochlamydoides]|uniref:uncharacterized protein n=1 Tax=Rasamsonia byssochlamydoides TaxID=89139 RepID=UPI003741FADF